MKLMEDYKKEPGGKEKLKEKNPKWINDDYVKFLRYGQYFIEKNGSGVLAFINPHGFLDNPTFRGMRWNLLKTYDKIYTIDLHGNSKKKETCPDGSPDVNVFDIMQGVAITVFVKTGKKKSNALGKVFHCDLFGKREVKYDFLNKNSLATVAYKELPNVAPNYFFVSKDFEEQRDYEKGFAVNALFAICNMGVTSGNDRELVDFSKSGLLKEYNQENVRIFSYRPFDNRFIVYETKFLARARIQFMQHLLKRNLAITLIRHSRTDNFVLPFIINRLVDKCISSTLDNATIFPLYLYPESTAQQTLTPTTSRIPNLNPEIVQQIAEKLGLSFVSEALDSSGIFLPPPTPPNIGGEPRQGQSPLLVFKEGVGGGSSQDGPETFAPIDLLDYIYAVLHSPSYREKYKEFLKIDFPRVPYPHDKDSFWQLVNLGGELRQIHLLESPVVERYITQYPVDGNNVVCKPSYQDGKVYINDSQYFAGVPEIAWNFYIGGYQPAQKWLKDRKERRLEFDDILHYQKIIVALVETNRLMKEIDGVLE
jgi:predicted helicase